MVTRGHVADEEAANAPDPVLAAVPARRRATLLATPADDGDRVDVRLQGPGETVAFAVSRWESVGRGPPRIVAQPGMPGAADGARGAPGRLRQA